MWSNRPISPPRSQLCWRAILEHFTPVSLWNDVSNKAAASLMAWLHMRVKLQLVTLVFHVMSALALFHWPCLSWRSCYVSSLIFAPPESASGWSLEQHPSAVTGSARQLMVDRAVRGGAASQQEAETEASPVLSLSSYSFSSSAAINNILPFIPESLELPVTPDP